MPATRIIPNLTYLPGNRTHTLDALTIPAGDTRLLVTLRRDNDWASNSRRDAVEFEVQLSLDGGSTWAFWLGGTTTGGPALLDFDGNKVHMTLSRQLPAQTSSNRRARVRIRNRSVIQSEIRLEST